MSYVVIPALTEKQFQRQVVEYARLKGYVAYHTYDSRRSQPGFPDLCLVGRRVIFVELKRENGRTTMAQEEWMRRLRMAGGEVYCWRPSDWNEIEAILGE